MDRLELIPEAVIDVSTFGCKVNTYDSGLIQQRLSQAGFDLKSVPQASSKRVHVLNSCAVTAEATAQALRQARRLKREDPASLVVVTGCSAQVDTERFAEAQTVDLIVANSHKGDLPKLLQDLLSGKSIERVYKSNIFKKEDLEAGGGQEQDHTRSFLKIQDGCDSFCTFCVIPFARGKSRSIEPEVLIKKINQMHQDGVNEVVLTGVHIGDYQSEKGHDLGRLVDFILQGTTIPRIRLSSLEPIELSHQLMDLFQNERMCRHFHMSIQSACTTVLEKMKRKYSAEQVTKALQQIEKQVPEAYVGMDVIAGFPEESDEEFEDTYQRLQDTPWTRLHVFPYSSRPNTYAARALNEVPGSLIHERALKLRNLSHERLSQHAVAQIGKTKQVLWLKQPPGQGLSRDYWSVVLNQPSKITSSESLLRVTGCEREPGRSGSLSLYGELIYK